MHRQSAFLAGLLATVLVVGCTPNATPLPPSATPGPTAALETATLGTGAIPMGFTQDGAPYRGDPDAPVTLLEFSEFL